MAVALVKHQAGSFALALGVKVRRCLLIEHLYGAIIFGLKRCPGLVDHYMTYLTKDSQPLRIKPEGGRTLRLDQI